MKRAALALALAACGHAAPPAVGPDDGSGPTDGAIPAGSYVCRLAGKGDDPCVVTIRGGTIAIAKTGGDDRFRGTLEARGHDIAITASDGAARFTGTLAETDNGIWAGTVHGAGWALDGARLELEYVPPAN